MSQIEFYNYEIVAVARGQKPVLYNEFGSYQGEWMLLAKDADQFYVYKGWYGSCSGCDALQAEDVDSPCDIEKALAFVNGDKDYRAFIEIPLTTALNLSRNGRLLQVLPANIRSEYSDIGLDQFAGDCEVAIKLECADDITVGDVIKARNQELKQRALKQFGYERFVAEAQIETIDEDGENKLLKGGDIVFAYVKDSSTPRRYLLRVPADMVRVKQAIAWTFGMNEAQYNPIMET